MTTTSLLIMFALAGLLSYYCSGFVSTGFERGVITGIGQFGAIYLYFKTKEDFSP